MGIIPACAGNTIAGMLATTKHRDHPRMRGEHTRPGTCPPDDWGSSPHARGTLGRDDSGHRDTGIIPACAGNTSRSAVSRALRRDHPRMRGEHRIPTRIRLTPLGSSPHARGTPGCTLRVPRPPGIIPACAGNTHFHLSEDCQDRDHPRMRGEHRQRAEHHAVPAWIIPACAGNTRSAIL